MRTKQTRNKEHYVKTDLKQTIELMRYTIDVMDLRIQLIEEKLRKHCTEIDAHKEPI